MHEAYEVFHLHNATFQIETIAAYDDCLFLGTRQGSLLMYSLTFNNDSQKYELQMLKYHKTFSKKPIQQIEVIPDDNLLICLTDNIVSIHHINHLNVSLGHTFADTKGASLFAIAKKSATSLTGKSNSVVQLCVAVRRKLLLYYGKNGEFKQHLFDFTVTDVPKILAYGNQYLCVGFKGEYTMFDLTSRNPEELFPTSSSKSQEPTIAKYSETSFLLGRDNTSVLVEEVDEEEIKKTLKEKEVSSGTKASDAIEQEIKKIEIKKTIKWKEAPIAVVWDEPFLLGLLPDNKVVVQTVEPSTFVQELCEINKARLMYRCKRGLTYVASVGQVWCVKLVDVEKQRQQLLKDKQFQIAIDLTNLSECSEDEKKQTVNSIQMLHALELFDSKEYAKSMREFIKLNTDPADVIKLFPELDNKPGAENSKKIVGKDLENALNALISYLVELRLKIGKRASNADGRSDAPHQRNDAQQLELIDTTLLKCYLQTNDALVAPLLRLNNCRLEEAERTLAAHGKHSELIILYQIKGQHARALTLLRDQSHDSLRGYTRTKNYLQQLGADHLNLIFKFSDWILKEHPEEGLKIFTEDITEVESLPRAKVLDFLLREHESLVIPYLEHVIHKWNETNALFHDGLIRMYREKITDKKANATEEELQHIKSKLVAFLEKSSHYTPELVILHFPNDTLFEERAIILGKLGRHEQALAIYVQILGDVERAIRYCETVGDKRTDKSVDVYVILMRILMHPDQNTALAGPLANVQKHPNSSKPDLETALSILEKHSDKISPIKALSVLPDGVPLSRLRRFLSCALDNQLAVRRRAQVLKGLLYAEHTQVEEMKRYHESKSLVINDYNVCPVCKKRFGNQSAFVRYPSGEIVHYSCRLEK